MPRWKKSDVEKLRGLIVQNESWNLIAAELERTVDAVKMKAKRLGLNVVVEGGRGATTTNGLPGELPSVEEILNVLVRLLKELDKPGLEMSEIQRLQAMVATIRTYENMLGNYLHYRDIEKRLVRLEAKYARLAKGQKT